MDPVSNVGVAGAALVGAAVVGAFVQISVTVLVVGAFVQISVTVFVVVGAFVVVVKHAGTVIPESPVTF